MEGQQYQVKLEVGNLDRIAAIRLRDFLLREMENAGLKGNTRSITLEKNINLNI